MLNTATIAVALGAGGGGNTVVPEVKIPFTQPNYSDTKDD